MSHHPKTLRAPCLWVGTLDVGTGPRWLLTAIGEASSHGRTFHVSQAKLGELVHRNQRTIKRWVRELHEHGWIRVIRRGKKLTNIYLLARWLWRRWTGQLAPKLPSELQETLFRIAGKMGFRPTKIQGGGPWTSRRCSGSPA